MSIKTASKDFYKRLLNQMSGDIDENHELIPEYCIVGQGHMWCYDPANKMMAKVSRGTKVYVLSKNYDNKGRYLVYTTEGLTICIDPEDIILTECD